MIEIVAILVAARDREDPSPDHVGNTVNDPRRIATLREYAGQLPGHSDPPLRQPQKQHAPHRTSAAPPSNAAVIFLRATAGKQNGRIVLSVMASVAVPMCAMGWIRQPNPTPPQRLTLHSPAFPRIRRATPSGNLNSASSY